jgi:hypothetical protein
VSHCMKMSLLALGLLALAFPRSVGSFLVPHHHLQFPTLGRNRQSILPTTRFSTCRSSGQIIGNRVAQSSSVTLSQQIQENDDNDNDAIPESRQSRLFRRGRNVLGRVKRRLLPVAASLLFWWAVRVSPVSAKPATTPTQIYSLRPGMSQTEATDLLEGRLDIKDLKGTVSQQQQQQESPVSSKKKPSQSVYGDNVQDAEDDFDLDEEDDNAFNARRSVSRADEANAKRMQARTTTQQFAGYDKPKTTMLYVKVGTGLFIPTFGVMFAREHVKQIKEEAYVKKGLAILKAQEAEYFNITSSTTDSELEDELKGLKNNSTDEDDEDDEDEDDEDDDDDDEPENRRRGPKRPRGGGDGDDDDGGTGSGSGSGGGSDPGTSDGKFTDEDRNRLNSLFDKS